MARSGRYASAQSGRPASPQGLSWSWIELREPTAAQRITRAELGADAWVTWRWNGSFLIGDIITEKPN